ncbi:MAG: hypothetical protein A3F68_05370 [Acidobacteria bacterium RIFCSPLOWO2_12_FULL_54_10]|nr:MAG: hypothetical protein A3F68_05370 [Acidobacteria bacterium RIFCSPLOWO2_12_FULL_54_10]
MKRPAASSPITYPRKDIIAEIKEFQRSVGFAPTGNFLEYSETTPAYYRCYYTGLLELPDSYEELKLTQGDAAGCSLNEQEVDLFFYAIEAVASGTNPVTPSLAEAPLERLLVVVPHEDFHNQEETEAASPQIGEAAATLIGFLTASEFASGKYGVSSSTAQKLQREAQLYREKATIVNSYYDRAKQLYAQFHAGEMTRQETLARKSELFTELNRECTSILPDPVSFNKCPAAMNNAGLAFDRTYIRYYPLLYEVYISQGEDIRATISALKRLMATGPQTEMDLAQSIQMNTPSGQAPAPLP